MPDFVADLDLPDNNKRADVLATELFGRAESCGKVASIDLPSNNKRFSSLGLDLFPVSTPSQDTTVGEFTLPSNNKRAAALPIEVFPLECGCVECLCKGDKTPTAATFSTNPGIHVKAWSGSGSGQVTFDCLQWDPVKCAYHGLSDDSAHSMFVYYDDGKDWCVKNKSPYTTDANRPSRDKRGWTGVMEPDNTNSLSNAWGIYGDFFYTGAGQFAANGVTPADHGATLDAATGTWDWDYHACTANLFIDPVTGSAPGLLMGTSSAMEIEVCEEPACCAQDVMTRQSVTLAIGTVWSPWNATQNQWATCSQVINSTTYRPLFVGSGSVTLTNTSHPTGWFTSAQAHSGTWYGNNGCTDTTSGSVNIQIMWENFYDMNGDLQYFWRIYGMPNGSASLPACQCDPSGTYSGVYSQPYVYEFTIS